MKRYPFMQVDAFTREAFGGNACAILFDADDIEAATRQRIAREQNLSETAFVSHSDSADFAVRYFTPSEEIPMAGHPTIATTWALVESGRVTLQGDVTTITLELQIGPLSVDIHASGGRPERVVMTQRQPEFGTVLSAEEVMPCFGLRASDAADAPLQIVSTGTPQLMIPMTSLDVLQTAELQAARYLEIRKREGFFTAHLFVTQGMTDEGDTFARDFVDPPALIEDPFTGSATGAMGAYLWYHGLVDTPEFRAEQGHGMGRPGIASVEVIGDRSDIQAVRVGGAAVTVVTGTMHF